MSTLYLGSAGMIWALDELGSSLDLRRLLELALEHERERVGRGRYTLFTGDVGVGLYLRATIDVGGGSPPWTRCSRAQGACGSLRAPGLRTGADGGGTTGPMSPSGASSRSTITGA